MWLKYKSTLLSGGLFRYDRRQLYMTHLTKACRNPATVASYPHLPQNLPSLSGLIASSLSDLGEQIK